MKKTKIRSSRKPTSVNRVTALPRLAITTGGNKASSWYARVVKFSTLFLSVARSYLSALIKKISRFLRRGFNWFAGRLYKPSRKLIRLAYHRTTKRVWERRPL